MDRDPRHGYPWLQPMEYAMKHEQVDRTDGRAVVLFIYSSCIGEGRCQDCEFGALYYH